MSVGPAPRNSIIASLQKYSCFSPWDYIREKELPTTLTWGKVDAPNACEVFRWDGYQKCDIVLIQTTGGLEHGLIVRAFDVGEKGIQCVIAWIYTRQSAKKNSFYSWPSGEKYLFSNHFQLVSSECFVRRARFKVRGALSGVNYDQGIDFSSRKLVKFKSTNNCIVEARRSMALPFASIPVELQDMVFTYMMNSEDGKDGTVNAERTGRNSWSSWGLRNASKMLQMRYDQAYHRQADCLARKSPQNHENELAR